MWKPVSSYDHYEVSDDGKVRRIRGFWCKSNRELQLHMSNSGYFRVCLSVNRKRNPKKVLVHRIVYAAFIGEIPSGMTINHLDGVKTNNRPENLELASRSGQMIHAYLLGLQKRAKGEDRGRVAKLNNAAVLEIRSAYVKGTNSAKALAERFQVSKGCIYLVVNRDRWGHI